MECRERILRPGVWDVAADDRYPAVWEALEGALHAHAEVAMALREPLHMNRQTKARVVRRDRQHGAEAPVSGEGADQPGQRGDMKPQGGAIADAVCQPPLHPAQTRRSGEHHHRVPHP